ncbi:hypothetical protein ACOCJ7_05525 [Knoellia sp. CPCC 206453]|uniref:hypothetical protein n=1 Tax=Knoellia pratensis TaxID=3404796 RepID=UPI0036206372
MGENTGVLRRAGSFVRGRPTTQKVGGGVAAALLASTPFGGLSGPPEPPPDGLRLGTPIMVGPFEVVIDKAVELPDLAPAVEPKAPQRVMVLDSHVTLKGDRPELTTTLTSNLRISGGGVKTQKPDLYFVDDATRLTGMNPDVTYRLAITFTTTGPWVGDTVTVKSNLVEFVHEDPLTLDSDAWKSRDEIASQGTLPVVRKS